MASEEVEYQCTLCTKEITEAERGVMCRGCNYGWCQDCHRKMRDWFIICKGTHSDTIVFQDILICPFCGEVVTSYEYKMVYFK